MKGLISIALLLLLPAHAWSDGEPEEMLLVYADHVRQSQWDRIADVMDEDTKEKLKNAMVDLVKMEIDRGGSRIQQMVFGKPVKLKQAKSTTAGQYLGAVMKEMAGSVRQQGFDLAEVKILGSVLESDDLSHLLVRVGMAKGDDSFSNLQVFSFTRNGDRWGMHLPANIKQLLEMMEFRYRSPR